MYFKNMIYSRSSQKGFVLVVTLLVTAVLVAVFVEFAYSIYISTARAGNFAQSQRASLLANNGVEIAQAAIAELLKIKPNLTIDKEGLYFVKKDGDAVIEVRAFDELGRVSTRIVYQNTGVINEKVFGVYSRLLKNLGIEDHVKLENTLADWIDSDGEPRVYGAEGADYYQGLSRPYMPANAYLESIDEMLMIKDYTPAIMDKIRQFVTVYSADGLININTAPREVLMSLSDDMTGELADKLMEYRGQTPFTDRSDIMKVHGFEKTGFSLQDRITVRSDKFRVYSKARYGDTVREVEAVIQVGKGILYWREM